MATSTPAKKQKVSRPPVIFKAPGLTPDVRFKVFDEYEFHVHSVVLKLGSAFFRKFFDPANKDGTTVFAGAPNSILGEPGMPTSALKSGFQYEWVSKIDDDGTDWHMISEAETNAPQNGIAASTLDEAHEIKAFENLLRAFYRDGLLITEAEDLITLTKLADYYCALKIVSQSLDATFVNCAYFKHGPLHEDAYELLECAVKLRNAALFKDLIIYCAGHWPGTIEQEVENEKSHAHIINKTHDQLCRKLSAANWDMEQGLVTDHRSGCTKDPYGTRKSQMRSFMNDIKIALKVEYDDCAIPLPRYYRELMKSKYMYRKPDDDEDEPAFEDYLDDLSRNNLNLRNNAISGEGDLEEYFLGMDIQDSDLPWDVKDTMTGW